MTNNLISIEYLASITELTTSSANQENWSKGDTNDLELDSNESGNKDGYVIVGFLMSNNLHLQTPTP